MQTDPATSEILRPRITEYSDLGQFVGDMVTYRKKTDPTFSVLKACKNLRRVSPTLITLIIKGNRRITADRIDELTILLKLTVAEKFFLKNWVLAEDNSQNSIIEDHKPSTTKNTRKQVSTHILNDWLNVYVKDCFQLPFIQENPDLLFEYLKTIASRKRIEKSLQFLLREGHLRKLLSGRIEPEVNLTVTDPKIPSTKIRKFHKTTLKLASAALDLHSPEVRLANSLLIPLSQLEYQEFLKLIEEFALKVQDFAAHKVNHNLTHNDSQTKLYQLILNLSPIGGIHK
jgi:uncharacterized protein (TIGR02147 family)